MAAPFTGSGTPGDPRILESPSLRSEYPIPLGGTEVEHNARNNRMRAI